MIVLPNSFERYLASLRIFVSISILKHGLQPFHLENLKKIYRAEAFYNKKTLQSVDIDKYCKNLLNAAITIKTLFSFRVFANGNRIINKSLFALLLLNIIKYSLNCSIYTANNNIIIKTENIINIISPIIKAMNGYYLRELFTEQIAIIIPAPETNLTSIYIESEWELIFDKFSIVNIIFNNMLL